MFRVVDTMIEVGGRQFPLQPGQMQIYIDSSGPNIEGKGKLLATVSYDERTGVTIEDYVAPSDIAPTPIANSMWNNYKVHAGALFVDGMGGDTPVAGYLEGTPVDFDYTSFIFGTLSVATYPWTGGRSCWSTAFGGVTDAGAPRYTGVPLAPCASVSLNIGLYVLSGLAIFPFAVLDMVSQDIYNYMMNRFSVFYFWYIHRRYYSIELYPEAMYSIKVSGERIVVGSANGLEDAPIPAFDTDMAMFNLKQ